MPAPLRPGPHLCGTLILDLGRERRAEPVPPRAHCFVANVYTTFVKQVFYLPQREWKTDIHHHSKADNLGRCLEITEGTFHPRTLRDLPPTLKPFSSDNATMRVVNCNPALVTLIFSRLNVLGKAPWKR